MEGLFRNAMHEGVWTFSIACRFPARRACVEAGRIAAKFEGYTGAAELAEAVRRSLTPGG